MANKREIRVYQDTNDMLVLVHWGIGDSRRGPYLVFRRTRYGDSMKRVKSIQESATWDEAQARLDEYAKKKGGDCRTCSGASMPGCAGRRTIGSVIDRLT